MALTPNFSTTQVVGFPENIVLEDTSSGSDAAITQRRIYLVNSEGDYVVPSGTATDYVDFPVVSLIGDEITINCLTADAALDITVQWLDVNNVVLYSKTLLKGFTLYNNTFLYSLTQAEASQSTPPNILQDTQYLQNKAALQIYIDSGNQAITYGDDITSAQNMYDAASYLVENENFFY